MRPAPSCAKRWNRSPGRSSSANCPPPASPSRRRVAPCRNRISSERTRIDRADVDDRWHKMVDGKKVRTEQYGKGKRWRARWRDEAGTQRQHSFDTKVDAERHVATVQADMLRRTYVDPRAGIVTFRAYAERWRLSQVHETSSQRTIES